MNGRRAAIAMALSAMIFTAHAKQTASGLTSREQLQQYVADLQKNPSDDALRKKIIKLAGTLQPPPAMPEEARKHFVKAETLAKESHDPAAAIEEYQQGLALAPWWADGYHDLGLIQEADGRYDNAKASLQLYLLSTPDHKDARAAQDEIYKIEAKQQKAVADNRADIERQAKMFVGRWGNESGNLRVELRLDSVKYDDNGGRLPLVTYVAVPPPSGPFPCEGGCSATVEYTIITKPYLYRDEPGTMIIFIMKTDLHASVGPPREFLDNYKLRLSSDGGKLVGEMLEIYREGQFPRYAREESRKVQVMLYRLQ